MLCVLSHFSLVCVWLSATPWTVAHQAPLSMGFSKQEYWSRWPCPPPADLPNPGIKPASLVSPALAGGFFTTSATWPCALLISVHIWRAALAGVEGLNVLMIETLRTMSCITKCFKMGFAINLKKSESHSVVSDSATPWNTQSMESSRPEYWSGQPFPSPGDLPNPGLEPRFPASQVDSLPAEPQGKPINLKVTQCWEDRGPRLELRNPEVGRILWRKLPWGWVGWQRNHFPGERVLLWHALLWLKIMLQEL